jgi:hypothetical protein
LELIGGHGICVERLGHDLESVRVDLLARCCRDCQVSVFSVHLLIVIGKMNNFKRLCCFGGWWIGDVVNFKSNCFGRKCRVKLRIDPHSLVSSKITL